MQEDNERENQLKGKILTVFAMGQAKDLSPTKKSLTRAKLENVLGSTLFVLAQCNTKESCCTTQLFECFPKLHNFQSFMNTHSEDGEERYPGALF